MRAAWSWPLPAHIALSQGAAASHQGMPACTLTFHDGRHEHGALAALDLKQGLLKLRRDRWVETIDIPFEQIRSVALDEVIALDDFEVQGEAEAWDSMRLARFDRGRFELRSGDMLEGETVGVAKHACGVFLLMLTDSAQIQRIFVPIGSLRSYRIGAQDQQIIDHAQCVQPERDRPQGLTLEGLQRTTDWLATDAGAAPVARQATAGEQAQLLVNDLMLAFGLSLSKPLRANRRGAGFMPASDLVTVEHVEELIRQQRSYPLVRLGDSLIEEGLATQEHINKALHLQRLDPKRPMGDILIGMGVITRKMIHRTLVKNLGISFVNLLHFKFDEGLLKEIPIEFVREFHIMPMYRAESRIVVAMEDPMATAGLRKLAFMTKCRIEPVMATFDDIETTIQTKYGGGDVHGRMNMLASELCLDNSGTETASLPEVVFESDNILVRLVNNIILDAHAKAVSDIHIETGKGNKPTKVRFRKDGLLFQYLDIPADFRDAVISRIKIMSRLDISEKRRPQDGKIEFERFGPAKIELRVATIPTSDGMENVVLRILVAPKALPLDSIGLAPDVLMTLENLLEKPYGVLFVCGPTGCGKTTTMHALIGRINTPDRKIWTAEDPIEITQEGLCQVQVHSKIKWNFAAVLRTFMRADPDVIMVGETRDPETAKAVIEASLTGHMVLSTLHTNSAVESVVRLLNLGLDPFHFSDALVGVLAQRLVRRLCPQCCGATVASAEALDMLAIEYCSETDIAASSIRAHWDAKYADGDGKIMLRHPVGCEQCDHSGYKGRLGVHELLVATAELKRKIHARANGAELLQAAINGGMRTLRHDGIDKIMQGLTDWQQVRRI